MKTAEGSLGEGSMTGIGCARDADAWLRVERTGLVAPGAEDVLGVYGRGLKDWAAGVKKLRSGVDVKRRLRGRVIALAANEDEAANESDVVRLGRDSDITARLPQQRQTCQRKQEEKGR